MRPTLTAFFKLVLLIGWVLLFLSRSVVFFELPMEFTSS